MLRHAVLLQLLLPQVPEPAQQRALQDARSQPLQLLHQPQLLPLIREEVKRQANSYIRTSQMEDLDNYIVGASLGDDQGILGAACLAMEVC